MTQQLLDTDSTAAEGERVFTALAPEGAVPPWQAIADLAPALGAQIRQSLGAIMARPQLDLRTRELATVCMLAAIGGCEPQLEFHIGGAVRAGATATEVIEAISQVYLYAGFPRTLNALQVAKKVLVDHRS